MTREFELTLKPPGEYGYYTSEPEASWAIFLPHQCDEWVITSDPDPAVALADARQFRAELDRAIATLEEAAP